MGNAGARRESANVGPASLLSQFVSQAGVVQGGEKEHQPCRRENSSEYEGVRHLQHYAQQRGQGEKIDENVRSKTEESVPISGDPCFWFCDRSHSIYGVEVRSAAKVFSEVETQPKMPPWALIIFRPISWNSGKYEPTQSERTRQS